MQLRVMRMTSMRSIWRGWMLLALIGILFKWLALAAGIPALGIIANSLAHSVLPLFEVLLITAVISMLLGTVLFNLIGHELESWSSASEVVFSLMRQFLIGAPH
jgi:hypothetical protein